MPALQPLPSPVSAAVARDVAAFARTLVAAVRAQQMYSSQHPTAAAAVERCRATLRAVAAHDGLVIGVTPTSLLANNEPLPSDLRIREAGGLLNDHDILRLRVVTQPSVLALSDFLILLSFDPDAMRRRGGPARIWEQYGHLWLVIDQIDYEVLLAGAAAGTVQTADGGKRPEPGYKPVLERDQVWRSLVRVMADGRAAVDVSAERRLLDIAQSPEAIHALAMDAADAQDVMGAAKEAAQAAAVLMTFQRLASFVELQSPQDLESVLSNIAEAAAQADPALLMRAIGEAAESGLGLDVVKAIGERFDDRQVADLLAAALAAEGKATARIASALHTLTPANDRQGRVLRLARHHAAESPSAPRDDVSSVWLTLERFLAGPADSAYVSRLYGESLEQAEARSNRVRLDAPVKLDEWMRSVAPESMRTLSATLLIDLFSLERNPAAVLETAKDLAVLTDDLLIAGDALEAVRVVEALDGASRSTDPERSSAAAAGLADVQRCPGLRETAQNVGELDDRHVEALRRVFEILGPATAPLLVDALASQPAGTGRARLVTLLVGFREHALDALIEAVAFADTDQSRTLVQVLVGVGGHRAITLLHAWARSPRPDLMREAVYGLVSCNDPSAAQAVVSLLRTGALDARAAAVDAVASSHRPVASGLLAGVLRDLKPLGREHGLCLRTLAALRLVGAADAVPAIADVMRARSWLAWRRAGRLKLAAVSVLAGMQFPEARQAIADAAERGDFRLRRAARAVLQSGA
jgi:hypothetical protein